MCSFLHAKAIVRYLFLICKEENQHHPPSGWFALRL
jgi:hypothetical protein